MSPLGTKIREPTIIENFHEIRFFSTTIPHRNVTQHEKKKQRKARQGEIK